MPNECEYSIEKHLVWFRWADMRQSLGNIIKCFSMISANQGRCWFILVPFLSSKFKNWQGLVVLISFYHSKKRFLLMHSIFSMSLCHPIVILRRFSLAMCFVLSSYYHYSIILQCPFCFYYIIFHNTLICFLLCLTIVAFRPIIICVFFLVLWEVMNVTPLVLLFMVKLQLSIACWV